MGRKTSSFEGADGYFGLLVDEVGKSATVLPTDFEGNPQLSMTAARRCLPGTYKLSNALLVMLDPERLDPVRLADTAFA